jgi:lipoprotein-anchoring transpeptidase ErfK/SrfK
MGDNNETGGGFRSRPVPAEGELVRLKKIVLGLSAVAAAAILAACGSGTSASGGSPTLAANTGTSTSSQAATSTTTLAPPTTTTTVAPPPATTTTTKKPTPTTTTKKPVQAQTTAAGVPCTITTGACVDLSARKTWLLKDGVVVYGPVHAEPGRTGWSTPVGTFHVISHVKNYVSKKFNAPMPYSTFFIPGIAFHEGSASTPSHGCIHLSLSAAETYFSDLAVGDAVQIVR